jgi:competence protein ComEA
MLKRILFVLAMLCAAASWAAVDVNRASEAELDSIKGIGPGTSSKILDERKKGPFKDWADLIARVPGVGKASAARLSDAGLTVDGAVYERAPGAKATKEAQR